MVAQPFAAERNRQTVAYVMEEPGSGKPYDDGAFKGLSYPSAFAGDRKRGEQIYGREGCAQCHTQVIRPDYAGIDQFKRAGARIRKANPAPVPTRQTMMWDYLHEDFAMIGQRRIGPDLANAGYRFDGKVGRKRMLPKSKQQNSASMISIFICMPRGPARSGPSAPASGTLHHPARGRAGIPNALKLPANLAPAQGMEIVPSSDAIALAEYVLGLKRDQALPVSITGAKPKGIQVNAPAVMSSDSSDNTPVHQPLLMSPSRDW